MNRSLSPEASRELATRVSPQAEDEQAFVMALPLLLVQRANLPKTATQLAHYLARAGHLFHRGPQVVRVVRTFEGDRIEGLNAHCVILETHKVCEPAEQVSLRGEMVIKKITLPTKVANLYLNLREDLNLPPLKGISAAPLLSDHGSIHCSAGYDKASGLWCTGVEMPLVLPKPTFEEARKALRAIRTVFASFPFADSVRTEANLGSSVDQSRDPGLDESSFLIALLTALCRPSLPLAPALLIRAPQLSGSGTGKGLLVHAISEIAFGQKSEAFTSRGERQELCKRIESTLLQSRPMLFLDNCNHETLVSNVLAQAITEPFVSTRALGQSKMISLSSTTFIVVTGNAVQISEDLARRFLVVSLDAPSSGGSTQVLRLPSTAAGQNSWLPCSRFGVGAGKTACHPGHPSAASTNGPRGAVIHSSRSDVRIRYCVLPISKRRSQNAKK